MTKFNLEKCKSGNKGITLIALIITIIVLLILAGITIASLTGSDSAPAKANEAKQRNDIGSAKDQLAVVVQNAHLEAYDDIYVKNNSTVSSTAANTTVGQRVINAVLDQYKAEKNAKVGDASIVVAQAAAGQDASITITTRDFTQLGSISYDGGVLTWQALTENGGGQQGGNSGEIDLESLPADSVYKLAQAGEIKRWDKINYDPGTGTTASINLPEGAKIEGTKLASLNLPAGASIDGTINASEASDWVVLDVNRTTGEVKIMPTTISSTKLTLTGKDGYNNAIQALDAVAGIYLNPTYATSARSLTIDDVNKAENHTPDGEVRAKTFDSSYSMNDNLDVIEGDPDTILSRTFTSSLETGSYGYDVDEVWNDGWLASRCIDTWSHNAVDFNVRSLGDALAGTECLFYVADTLRYRTFVGRRNRRKKLCYTCGYFKNKCSINQENTY